MFTLADQACDGCTRCHDCGWKTCTEQTGTECPTCSQVLCPECAPTHTHEGARR